MLPIYLSIEGLYSYQEKQEIDFTKLTEAGLFGIFGNVGSGKSSILEAISYALYGETERLNKQEKRAYNMLNLKSDKALIDFQFLNFQNRKFRFLAQWKRRKKFEETTSIERTAYEWISNEWTPLESVDGALITNLSYPNFRRTIIIPQGQFKEFLELKGKERSDMMKEIFFLNQYDLGPKVGVLQAENNRKLENIKGALTGFQEVSIEIKEQKEIEYQKAKDKLAWLKNALEKHNEHLKKLTTAKQNHQDLLLKEEELAILKSKKEQIHQIEKEIEEFESVALHFKEHINNHHRLTESKKQLLKKIETLQEQKDILRTKIDENQRNTAIIKADFDNLDNFKRQLEELTILIQNTDLILKKDEILARIEKGTPMLQKIQKEIQQHSDTLEKEEIALEQLKSKRINTDELLAIEAWFQVSDQIQKTHQELQSRLLNNNSDIEKLKQVFLSSNLQEDTWKEALQQQWNKLQEDQLQIQEKEGNLRLKHELAQYINNLHDGEPCPLCGSKEHPDIMHSYNLQQDQELVQKLKNVWSESEKEFRQTQSKLTTTSQLLQDKLMQGESIKEDIEKNELEKQKHWELFQWNTFDKDNRNAFEELKTSIKEQEKTIEAKELNIQTLRKTIEHSKNNIEKYEKSLSDFKNQVTVIDAKVDQGLSQINILQELLSSNLTKMELSIQLNQIREKIVWTENKYKKWSEEIQFDSTQLATVQGQLNEIQEQYKLYTNQLQKLQSTINSLLQKFDFEDITAVINILNKNIESKSLKEKVKEFYLKLNTISNRINELKIITKDENYSLSLFQEVKEMVKKTSEEYELQISISGSLEKEIERLVIELDKKLNLTNEFEKLNNRKDNLRILDNMFKGNGFVNYVSSIHLERLCEIANTRFHRLTKNQLSLCMNESNEFEVKDYLNNGYQRSVKTLSGGQSFQASLCLALALAENIQALNKADRNFFFLDEGFGTQDAESINTVFDTLQYLHKENRVVGIISHVEDLKEKVPRSINVTKDNEKGSQITFN